jgi:hypothetical protein
MMRIYRISAPPRIDGNGERFVLFAPSLGVAREQWRAAWASRDQHEPGRWLMDRLECPRWSSRTVVDALNGCAPWVATQIRCRAARGER